MIVNESAQPARPEGGPVDHVTEGTRRHIPWREVVGLLASCLLVVIAFATILVGGRTLSSAGDGRAAGTNGYEPFPDEPSYDSAYDFRLDKGASVWQTEPWAEAISRAYSNGEIPLWNPHEGAGTPLAGNMVSAVFDPLLIAVNLHPTPLTWDLSILGAFVLGAAAAYLFGRILGLRVIPATVTSATFSLSGWFFMYSNNPFSRSYVFLPLLFLLVELTLRSRRMWPILVLAVAIAGNLYVGMPEASFFVIGAASVYAAVRLAAPRTATPIVVSLARLSGSAVLGLLLAAPLLLLFFEYERLSFNIHKPGDDRGTEADPALGVLHLIAPWFPGAPEPPPGPRNWFGAAVAIAALIAVSGREETRRLHAWFFFALGSVFILKMYDFHLLEWVGHLPIANLVVFHTFAPPVASLALAVLAGIGVQVLWSRELRVRRFVVLATSLVSVIVVALIAGERASAIVGELQMVWVRAAFFAVAAIAAAVLAARLGRRWGGLLLAGLIVAELFWLAPFTIYAKRADPYLAPGWMPLVRVAQGSEPYSRVLGIDGKLYPNTAAALGLHDIRTLDALYVGRYWRYVQSFIQPEILDRFTAEEGTLPRLENNPMFDALGVRAVLSSRNLDGVPALRPIGRDRDTRVYENARAYPRAWVVHDVQVVGGEDEAFALLKARARRKDGAFIVDSFDPRREAVVEHGGNSADAVGELASGRGACAQGDPDQATIEDYSGNSVSLRVEAACPGLLVLTDTYFPGWKATVNGRAQTIFATDGAFRGVVVPAGTSEVEFQYAPRAFSIGVVIALAGLVGFIVACLASWRLTRRESASSDARPRPVEQ